MSAENQKRAELARHVGKDDNATWPAYAWPGGYPIAYVMDGGESLCAPCMDTQPVTFAGDDPQWNVIGAIAFGADTDYPEMDETCVHCGRVICQALA